jgi:outer membrane receptor for ferrienterochelin and colicin
LFEKNLDNLSLKDFIKLKSDNYYLNANYKDVWGDDWVVFGGISGSLDKDWIDFNSDKVQSFVTLGQIKFTVSKKLLPGSYITFGTEGQFSNYEDQFNQFNVGLNENYFAGFAETDILFSNDIALKAGLRSEYSKYLNKTNIAPRISLAYRLGSFDQLNFAYGKFYQSPEKDFLLYSNNFNYETANHYIANYQYIGNGKTFRIEFYYKDYNSLAKGTVNTYPFINVPPVAYSNNGNGYAKGIDVFWRDSRTFQYTDYWISYSYLDTKRDYRNFPFTATPPFAAPHTFSVVFKRWFDSITSMIGITYSLSAGRPYFNPNNTEFLGDRTPVYHNLSANISYVFNLFNNFTVLFFSIDNVPGINNVFGYRYSTDGKISEPIVAPALRTVFLGLFISLGQKNPYQ